MIEIHGFEPVTPSAIEVRVFEQSPTDYHRELDTGRNALTAEDKPKVLLRAITNFYELMKVGGYRIVASEPDACVGRIEDQGPGPKRFNTKTQVFLYKL